MNLPKTILVATDFSEMSEAAVEYAVALANKLGAKLCVVNAIGLLSGLAEIGVMVSPAMVDAAVRDSEAAMGKLLAKYEVAKLEPVLRTGDPRDVIINTAVEVGAELIIMGTHGRRGVTRALLGSVAEAVLRRAHCPVLTIRKPT